MIPYSPISPGSITLSICFLVYMGVCGVQKFRTRPEAGVAAAASCITREEAWKDRTATLENIALLVLKNNSENWFNSAGPRSRCCGRETSGANHLQPPHNNKKSLDRGTLCNCHAASLFLWLWRPLLSPLSSATERARSTPPAADREEMRYVLRFVFCLYN